MCCCFMGAFLRVVGGARSPGFCVALRAATFRLRDDGVHSGATRMPARTVIRRCVWFPQQKPMVVHPDVPFGTMFDTELSRKWNVCPAELRRRKRCAGFETG